MGACVVAAAIGLRGGVQPTSGHPSDAAEGHVVVTVRHVVDPRLATLSSAEVATVLDRARALIRDAGGPDVTFSATALVSAESQLVDIIEGDKPLPVPSPQWIDPAAVEVVPLVPVAEQVCRAYGRASEFRSLLGLGAGEVKTYRELATAIATSYARHMAEFIGLTAETADHADAAGPVDATSPPTSAPALGKPGTPILAGSLAPIYRLSTWGVRHTQRPFDAPLELSLFNGFTFEDGPSDAGPHSLYTGQAFGLTDVSTNTSVVAYHLILRERLEFPVHRLGQLSRDEKLSAIAYVVAHEVGNHLALHLADDFAPTAGIGRPLASLSTKSELRPTASAPGLPTGKRLALPYFKLNTLRHKLIRATAQHDAAALAILKSDLEALDVPPSEKQQMLSSLRP